MRSTLPIRDRAMAAVASAAILAGLAAVLVVGLRPPAVSRAIGRLIAVSFAPVSSPPRVPPPPPALRTAAPRERPAPTAALRQTSQVIAPTPPVVLVVPPIPSALVAGTGQAAQSGAATAGTGSGGGDAGNGSGGGGSGGAGDGSGLAARAHQTRGRLSPRDVPDGLIQPGGSVSVGVRFTVQPDGRAVRCSVTRSSGNPAIDAVPCPLIESRYRFRPARDRSQTPVPEIIDETHTWFEPVRDHDRPRLIPPRPDP